MSANSKARFSAIGRAFEFMGAAIAVSAAVENHRRPANSDLNTLGIDPKVFPRVR